MQLIVMASMASQHPAVTASSMERFMKHVSLCMFVCVRDVPSVKTSPLKPSNPWEASGSGDASLVCGDVSMELFPF